MHNHIYHPLTLNALYPHDLRVKMYIKIFQKFPMSAVKTVPFCPIFIFIFGKDTETPWHPGVPNS